MSLADSRLQALTAHLARSLPAPSGVILAAGTEGSHSIAFDLNGLQLIALFQGHPLAWHGMLFRWGEVMVQPPRGEVQVWAIEQAGGHLVKSRNPAPEIPLRAVVLVALPQDLAARMALIEASTKRQWRVDRALPMPFGHQAWILLAEGTHAVEDGPRNPAQGSPPGGKRAPGDAGSPRAAGMQNAPGCESRGRW